MRRVRVPGVPADFRVPRGWPTPTDRWIAANAFWHPPAGWAPLPDLEPAQEGWAFWAPNPEWDRTFASNYRIIALWQRAGDLLGLAWLALVVAGILAPGNVGLAIAAGLFAGAAFACVILYEVLRRRVTRRGMEYLAGVAASARGRYLIRLYRRYLRDAA